MNEIVLNRRQFKTKNSKAVALKKYCSIESELIKVKI